LLSVEEQAGHHGAERIDDVVRNWTRNLSFLMKLFAMEPKANGGG
jgi:protease II